MYHHVEKQVEKRKTRRVAAGPYSKLSKPKQHVVPLLLSEGALRQKINDGIVEGIVAGLSNVNFAPATSALESTESKKATAPPVKHS